MFRDGVPDEDRRRLYQHARLTLAEQDAVNALVHLGGKLLRVSCLLDTLQMLTAFQGPGDKESKKKFKQKPTGDEYELSRYKPALRSIVEDQVADRLDPTTFPYVKDSPSAILAAPRSPPPPTTSLRSQKPAWHRAPKAAAIPDNKQRLFLFVAGGATYSEIRETYLLSSQLSKDIYIGASCLSIPGLSTDIMVN